jgi:16S rRNA G966 N2-methylase RsmD
MRFRLLLEAPIKELSNHIKVMMDKSAPREDRFEACLSYTQKQGYTKLLNVLQKKDDKADKLFDTLLLTFDYDQAVKEKFDYIFMDPPYNLLHEKRVLEYLSNSTLLSEDGIIIVEASLETDFAYAEKLGFCIIKEKEYKTNKHIFLEKEA